MNKFFSNLYINPSEMICFLRDDNCVTEELAHTHEFYELEYIYSGTGIQVVNGVEYPVSKGDVLFFDVGDVHSYRPIENFSLINCIFLPRFLNLEKEQEDKEVSADSIPSVVRLNATEIMEIEKLIMQMETEYKEKQFGYLEALRSYLNVILIKIIRSAQQGNSFDKKMLPIVEYIEKNYANIRPSDVASFSSYNQSYLSKMFKENIGVTITEYINNKRVESAIQLLQDTDLPIEKICYIVGFKEKKYFYKCFKKITGVTPSVMRKKGVHTSESSSI